MATPTIDAEKTPTSSAPNIKAERAPSVFANRLFHGTATGAGILILVVLAAVAIFLIIEAWPALTASNEELQSSLSSFRADSLLGYVGPLIFGTILAAMLALLIATPVSIGVALFISHYAPRKLAQPLGYLVDLLAAIPSVVYGLWGALWLLPILDPLFKWLSESLSDIWLIGSVFEGYQAPAKNILAAATVLAVMILPIITAVSREVFLQTPRLHEEASLALGATRWEMVRMAVLPFGRSGITSAAMLGLGRALGETMAVLMILSPGMLVNNHILKPGQHQTIAANIASQFPEAHGLGISILIATGLALFVITFAVNFLARAIINRRKDFSGAN